MAEDSAAVACCTTRSLLFVDVAASTSVTASAGFNDVRAASVYDDVTNQPLSSSSAAAAAAAVVVVVVVEVVVDVGVDHVVEGFVAIVDISVI